MRDSVKTINIIPVSKRINFKWKLDKTYKGHYANSDLTLEEAEALLPFGQDGGYHSSFKSESKKALGFPDDMIVFISYPDMEDHGYWIVVLNWDSKLPVDLLPKFVDL